MVDLLGKRIALSCREKTAGIVVEFRAKLFVRHRILSRAAIVFFHFFEYASVFQHYLDRALEAAGARIIRIDAILDAAR